VMAIYGHCRIFDLILGQQNLLPMGLEQETKREVSGFLIQLLPELEQAPSSFLLLLFTS
jgi:hypothetical protein